MLKASGNEVSLFLRKPQEALLWSRNKDRCPLHCFWQTFYDYEGTSLSMKLTLWLADGRGRKRWMLTDGMELLGQPALEHAL